MERDCHDTISGVEGLLDSVTVVNVNVDVEHTCVVFEQFQDAEDNVIDVAETAGLGFLRMVQTTGPIDRNVCLVVVETHCTAHAASSADLTVLVQAIEHGAVLPDVEPRQLRAVLLHIVRSDLLEEVDVVIGMEL